MSTEITKTAARKMSNEEICQVTLIAIRRCRVDIQIILEKVAALLKDDKFSEFIKSLRPRKNFAL